MRLLTAKEIKKEKDKEIEDRLRLLAKLDKAIKEREEYLKKLDKLIEDAKRQ